MPVFFIDPFPFTYDNECSLVVWFYYLHILFYFLFLFLFYLISSLSVACPTLAKIPHVLVIHGEGDGTLDHMKV